MNGRYVERGGMLVPVDAVAELGAAAVPVVDVDQAPVEVEPARVERARREPVPAEVLRERLAAERAVIDVRRDDERTRREAEAEHRMALADVDEVAAETRRERKARLRDARQAAKLERYRLTATRAGERARIRSTIDQSAEVRALRVARLRTAILAVGMTALVAFAAWSTAGVQAGVARLLDLERGSFGWVAAWAMEPALMSIVALIIVTRAVLESSGGCTDWRSYVVEGAALAASIALNAASGNYDGSPWKVAASLLAHSIGPAGAAVTAYLLGLLLGYVHAARPWDGVPRLADLLADSGRGAPDAIRLGKRAPEAVDPEDLPEDLRVLRDEVRAAITSGVLAPDPSAYAIYKHVMGGRGDRQRSTDVARLVAGWRPAPTGQRVNGRRPALVGGAR